MVFQIATRSEFRDHVVKFTVLHKVVDAYDVWMNDRRQDLKLLDQKLLLDFVIELVLGDKFNGEFLSGCLVSAQLYYSEGTLTKHFDQFIVSINVALVLSDKARKARSSQNLFL